MRILMNYTIWLVFFILTKNTKKWRIRTFYGALLCIQKKYMEAPKINSGQARNVQYQDVRYWPNKEFSFLLFIIQNTFYRVSQNEISVFDYLYVVLKQCNFYHFCQ